MLFGSPPVSLANWKGTFYLKGQMQPITIPTYITLADNKGLMNSLGMPIAGISPISSTHAAVIGKTATQVRLQTPCASNPTGPHCNNQDPMTQGCNRDARTLSYSEIRNQQGVLLATVQRRYSPTCSSEWGRVLASPNDHQPTSISIANHETRSSPGPVVFSTMVFVPNLSIASQIIGSVSINGTSGSGLTAFLPAFPVTKQ